MWEEKNTGSNLPAQIELYADDRARARDAYKFLFMAKGGGSANKSYLYQETKAVLNPKRMLRSWRRSCARSAPRPARRTTWPSSSAAPRAEFALKTAKYASAKYLDALPASGSHARARLPRRRAGGSRCSS